jgi:hypothetical protein
MLDKLLAQADPIEATAMLMGGTMTLGGILPPMTRMLVANSDNADSAKGDFVLLMGRLAEGSISDAWTDIQAYLGNGDTGSDQRGKDRVALFCSGAVEVYLMSKLFGNPEFFKAIGSLGSGLMGGITGVAKIIA